MPRKPGGPNQTMTVVFRVDRELMEYMLDGWRKWQLKQRGVHASSFSAYVRHCIIRYLAVPRNSTASVRRQFNGNNPFQY